MDTQKWITKHCWDNEIAASEKEKTEMEQHELQVLSLKEGKILDLFAPHCLTISFLERLQPDHMKTRLSEGDVTHRK